MIENKNLSSIIIDDTVYEAQLTKKYLERKKYVPLDPNKIYDAIPGVVHEIVARPGQSIKKGERLVVLEAMKMMNNIISPRNGKVKEIFVKEGDMVTKGTALLEIE